MPATIARRPAPPGHATATTPATESTIYAPSEMDLEPHEIRVLGCLLEKQRTTPDAYPLTLNALRIACNQSTNRDPVVDYDEGTVRDALTRLARRRFTRLTSGPSTRAPKFRHLLDEALPLPEPELSLLAVLMLRGAQTPGELKQRVERLHPVAGLAAIGEALGALHARELVARLPRRPGQKEERYADRLGEDAPDAPDATEGPASAGGEAAAPRLGGPGEPAPGGPAGAGAARLDALEAEVAALRGEVAALRAALAAAPGHATATTPAAESIA